MKILVADDDPTVHSILLPILSSWGYEATGVELGNDAVTQLLDPAGPRIAILDWEMPDLDGVEVCKIIKAQSDLSFRFLLLLTARDDRDSLLTALEAGADEFLSKPVDVNELRVRLLTGKRILDYERQLEERNSALHNAIAERDDIIGQLRKASESIKALRGLVPICSHCKKIRNDNGYWEQLESFIGEHSEAELSHGVCPDCASEFYPEYAHRHPDIDKQTAAHDCKDHTPPLEEPEEED